jgi:DNA repair protein RecO (recombination protein O)
MVLTNALGKISVIAPQARKNTRRYAGGLEPFHGLTLTVDEPIHGELFRLRDTKLRQLRLRLVQNLNAMNVAGRALSWVRRSLPFSAAELAVFTATECLLGKLDETPPDSASEGEARLGEFGLRLLHHLGWALEFTRCVRCGRECPESSPATVDPANGGLVCRNCGGGRYRVTATLRRNMMLATRGEATTLSPTDASAVLDIVEQTLLHHPGVHDT